MARSLSNNLPILARSARLIAFALTMLCAVHRGFAQDTPLLSGGLGFTTNTNAGQTTYTPTIQPLLAAPIGKHFFVESRASMLEFFSPNGNNQPGYTHSHYIALAYLEGDYIASPHLTIALGSFLIPFNSYNERLSPIWIGNFQSGPLIGSLGTLASSGTGGMVRGSAISRANYSIAYAAFFAARSGNQQFFSTRGAGGRVSLYLPEKRLEIGLSYDRQLQGTHENFYGLYTWWEPKDTAFRLRGEFSRGHHAQGYWLEADYRTQAFGGLNSWVGRFEPVFRMQQTFRRDILFSDGLPPRNTVRADFGLDYNLPHSVRILTSYSRQFSSTGNFNVWQTTTVYRFLFPAWKGK
jgi:hypothetical protein